MLRSLLTLRGAAVLFIVTWVIHSADHIRRGTDLTSDGVIWAGNISAVLAAIALTLIFTGHRLAPFAAAAVFGALAVGVTASHVLPDWGYISEPLVFDSQTDVWAAFAAIPEIFAAAWLAWIGFRQVQATNYQVIT